MKTVFRSLAGSPGFALVSIITVALGIASVTAIYSVAHAVVIRPLPFRAEESLAWVWSTRPDRDRAFFSIPQFQELKAANTTTADLAAITPLGFSVTGLGEPERVSGWRVTGNLFPLLGVKAHLGRLPGAEDDAPGAAPLAVLGHGYWQRRFGGDPAMVGRTIVLNGTAHTLVGILPPSFFIPTWESDIVVSQPLSGDPRREERGIQFLRAIARLKPGVSCANAQAEFASLSELIRQRYPDTDGAITPPRFVPLRIEAIAGYGNSLLILLGAAGVLLLIMSANLAGLLAARALARERDAALRLALGASPAQLFRAGLAEGLMIAGIGGGAGIAGCFAALRPLLALAPADLPRATSVSVDLTVFSVALGCTLVTGLAIGFLPALRLSRTSASAVLKSGSATMTSRSRARGILVGAQIALCTVLLTGTGLFVRSLRNLLGTEPGFVSRGVLAVQVSFPDSSRGLAGIVSFVDEFSRRLQALPGVDSASLTSVLPLSGINTRSEFTRTDRPPSKPSDTLSAANRFVLENYFATVGIPLRRGRDFVASDDARSRPVVIIDQALADRFWPGEDPVGKSIKLLDGRVRRELEIIGVAGATKHFSLEDGATPALYLPVRQMTPTLLSFFVSRMNFVVRTGSEPAALKDQARRVLHALEPDASSTVRSLEEVNAWAKAPRIFNLRLLGLFSGVAVLLAAIGLYAITAESVTSRTREIGIRLALGADHRQIVRQLLGDCGRIVAGGICLGLLLAAGLAPLGAKLLYGVRAVDPATYGSIATLLAIVALLASWLPARRATRVDPIIALRNE